MGNMGKSEHLSYRFGSFCVDPTDKRLFRNGRPVALPPKLFDTLLLLVESGGRLLEKEEFLTRVWKDSMVEEVAVAHAISHLRKVLRDGPDASNVIETVSKRGYRFTASVEILGAELPGTAYETLAVSPFESFGAGSDLCPVEVAEDPTENLVSPAEQAPRFQVVSAAGADRPGKIHRKLGIVIGTTLCLVVAIFAVWRGQSRMPTVANIVRLTNDRTAKIPVNGAVTDGLHLYFVEGGTLGSGSGIAQVSATGGETTWITTSLKDVRAILDISSDKSKLLLVAGVAGSHLKEFWVQPLPAGTPRPVGNLKAFSADWTPDGSHIIYSYQHKIAIVNEDGSDPHTIAEVPGSAGWFRYSPDGRLIRFSILQDLEHSSSLWEMRADGTNLHPLLPNWKESLDQCCGRWAPDGNYYYFLTSALFSGGGGLSQGIWVMPEHRSIFRRDREPVRLTTGPLRFGAPTPSTDGKSLFAVGDELRVELFSYDPHAQRFESYLGGLSAGPVAFSPDGEWVAYVSYPDMALWKCRTDLSEKMQLTFPPVRVYGPQWSPDGSQIAFGDVQFHRPPKVYLVSASGGDSPKQISPSNIGGVDTDPTWTPDGKSIIFSRAPAGERPGQAIYRLDLNGGNLTLIPGSNSLYSPRISPDGRYIAALTADAKQLTLLDQTTNSWSTLAEGDHFGFNEWSLDGKYVYAQKSGDGFGQIVRIRIKDRVQEEVLSLKDFPQLVDPFAEWYGLTPDGKILLMRDRSVQEIYALDLAKK
jgi:Tol biopolymer transport system component/DNA-binding winged helix-turn-helix (wHTH) protein